MTRSRDVSAVQNNLGVAIPPMAAGKNAVINGGFDIWQRGTSFTIASSAFTYIADRWQIYRAATGCTVTRQATGDTTNLPNIQYAMRIARDSGNTSTSIIYAAQSMESINSIPFAGKTVTFSFYARAGANYSATGNALNAYLYSGTGTDQNVLSAGYTGQTAVVTLQPATLTTTWQRFTGTGTVAATATELGVYYTITPTGTAGANDYVEITGVQLELGSSATPFSRAGGTIQGELAACQRYYWRIGQNTDTYSAYTLGFASSTTNAFFVVPHPVNMRVKPTSLDYSTLLLQDGTNGLAVSALALSQQNEKFSEVTATVTGATQYRPYRLINNNSTNGYIGFNAEL